MIFAGHLYTCVDDPAMLRVVVLQGIRPALPSKDWRLSLVLSAAWDTTPSLRPTASQFMVQLEGLELRLMEKQRRSIWGKTVRVFTKSISRTRSDVSEGGVPLPIRRTQSNSAAIMLPWRARAAASCEF